LGQANELKLTQKHKIQTQLDVAKTIWEQQVEIAKTRGRRVANRIVSFHWPEVRPIIRGKEGKAVEFGPKAHIASVDGFAFLDRVQYDAFNEGILLEESLSKHTERFGTLPELTLADQLYANRANRQFLDQHSIEHAFKTLGRPPSETKEEKQKRQRSFKKRQGQRNHIEASFGHLKSRFNLNKINWTVPGGETMQIQLGLIAFNLNSALAKA